MNEFERSLKKAQSDVGLAVLLHDALRGQSAALYRCFTPKNNRGVPCDVEWCGNVAYAKRLCNAHYMRLRSGKDMDAPLMQRNKEAKCVECGDPVDGKGGWSLCKPHYRAKRRRVIRAVCIEYLGGACARCGGSFPPSVYDFHHRDPSKKENDPSTLVDIASVETIAAEVEKCELLCANCHRIEHND